MMELMTTEMERGDKDEEGAEKRREEKTGASQRDAKTVASQSFGEDCRQSEKRQDSQSEKR